MILITALLSIVLAVLLLSKPTFALRDQFSARRKQPIWHEDALFMESFGKVYTDLNSDHSRQLMEDYHQQAPHVTHFCFLVHGYMGFSKDLSYLETVMRLLAEQRKHELVKGSSNTRHDIVVHCPTCNEHRTTDGVEKGGERLLEEILKTIRSTMMAQKNDDDSNTELKQVTISLLGNSLGGIYCRYSIARLMERTDNMVLDSAFKLHFRVFCTTATPHLGLSKHTYFPLPRAAEVGMAHTMGDTGKDLFRLNDLLKTMATSPEFLKPLELFRKRIAYANAFGTDFPVPTATAAFLHADSTSPHHPDQTDEILLDDQGCVVLDDNGLVVAVFHTPCQSDASNGNGSKEVASNGGAAVDHADDLAIMSNSLDSLGWKKVFVDLRNEIPVGVNLPRLRRGASSYLSDDEMSPLKNLKTRKVVGSGEVAEATRKAPDLNRIAWPLGHNMIVAFSRDKKRASFYKGGRPVVDALANELIEFIFAWELPVEE